MGQAQLTADLTDDRLYAEGKTVRVVVMSDTHNRVQTAADAKLVPEGDVFIHCGDFTEDGTAEEIIAFNKWLGLLPHKLKVVIPGNHDLFCHPESYDDNVRQGNRHRRKAHNSPQQLALLRSIENAAGVSTTDSPQTAGQRSPAVYRAWRNLIRTELLSNATHYLEGQTVTLNVPGKRSITLAGAPYTDVIAISAMRAFSLEEKQQTEAFDEAFADDGGDSGKLDILVTHGPPRGVLDRFVGMATGSTPLARKLARMQQGGVAPPFHVFGHVHPQHGVQVGAKLSPGAGQPALDVGTTFINAAAVEGRKQRLRQPPAICFDLPVERT